MISLRFIGGPLDGRTHSTKTPAYEYRIVGGVYRRGRTRRSSAPDDGTLVVYSWRPEASERWHTPAVEPARTW